MGLFTPSCTRHFLFTEIFEVRRSITDRSGSFTGKRWEEGRKKVGMLSLHKHTNALWALLCTSSFLTKHSLFVGIFEVRRSITDCFGPFTGRRQEKGRNAELT